MELSHEGAALPEGVSSARPVRKGRRRLVVALVLVFASMVSWWYWPRGDARFVGKWQIVLESGPVPSYMVFRRSGAGFTEDAAGKTLSHFSWETDGDVLIYRPPLGLTRSPLLSAVNRALSKSVGTRLLDYEQRADVFSMTDDLLQTRLHGSGNVFNLRRAPSP